MNSRADALCRSAGRAVARFMRKSGFEPDRSSVRRELLRGELEACRARDGETYRLLVPTKREPGWRALERGGEPSRVQIPAKEAKAIARAIAAACGVGDFGQLVGGREVLDADLLPEGWAGATARAVRTRIGLYVFVEPELHVDARPALPENVVKLSAFRAAA